MPDKVKRFTTRYPQSFCLTFHKLGEWVRYPDHEKLEAERDALADIMLAAAGNLINSADPRKIAERLTAHDAIPTRVREMDEEDQETAAELDRAVNQRDEELRERLESDEAIEAALRVSCQGFDAFPKGTQREAISRQRLAVRAALDSIFEEVDDV